MCVDCWGKNWFWSKLSKNGHFLLNEVLKITNNQKISKIRKCSQYITFTWILNFRAKNWPWVGPRPPGPPGTRKSGLARPGFNFFNFFFFVGHFYINRHCLVVPEMIQLSFSVFPYHLSKQSPKNFELLCITLSFDVLASHGSTFTPCIWLVFKTQSAIAKYVAQSILP